VAFRRGVMAPTFKTLKDKIMENEKRIIEINGAKFEIDMRTAKQISEYKIGDKVKVLLKEYNSTFKSHPGVIVGFDGFVNLPTIIVAFIKTEYNSSPLSFLYLNAETKEAEICPAGDDVALFDKANIEYKMNREIEETSNKLKDLISKRDYFLGRFGEIFSE
jgi:hypothetical protein